MRAQVNACKGILSYEISMVASQLLSAGICFRFVLGYVVCALFFSTELHHVDAALAANPFLWLTYSAKLKNAYILTIPWLKQGK
jgi:hypothetical protein